VNWGNDVVEPEGGIAGGNPGMIVIGGYQYRKEGTYHVIVTVTAVGGCENPSPFDYTFKYTQ
jgi:hypothetical protein